MATWARSRSRRNWAPAATATSIAVRDGRRLQAACPCAGGERTDVYLSADAMRCLGIDKANPAQEVAVKLVRRRCCAPRLCDAVDGRLPTTVAVAAIGGGFRR